MRPLREDKRLPQPREAKVEVLGAPEEARERTSAEVSTPSSAMMTKPCPAIRDACAADSETGNGCSINRTP